MEITIPHSLQNAIKSKKILLFIGAGVSKMSGLPLWNEIVMNVLKKPSIEKGQGYLNALEQDLFPPLEILDKIKDSNIKDVYEVFESSTTTAIKHPIYEKLTLLSRKIITTNYDNLIEYNTQIEVIDPTSTYKLSKLDGTDEFILKIHGSCNAIDHAIIFSSDYETLYSSNNGLAKFQLQKLISSHSCLFIGFSLSDPYITDLFNTLDSMYDGLGVEHFVISTDDISHKFVETIKINCFDDIPIAIDALINIKEIDLPTTTPVDQPAKKIITSERENLLHGQDTPPKIEYWAGRTDELEALKLPYKVIFITGIGGQGKSALASKFLSESDKHIYTYCDWRDFKEEELNLQTKLYSLIELVSNGSTSHSDTIGLDTETLVNIFFNELNDKKGLFVFDNIDKYIDLQKFTPSGDMKLFFEKAINTQHNSKFIFTCRPFIHYAGIGSHQVRLEGLKISDVKELIKKYHNKVTHAEIDNTATRLHVLTQGHPLWMGLILAQSRLDFKVIDNILKKIEHRGISESDANFSSMISATVLENLWDGLKEKEKIILRTLSICNVSESEEDLSKIVERKINFNQYTKAIRALKHLNLIISKESEGYIELHPLVKEFIKGKYDKKEQESYITLYVNYLNGFILLIKQRFGHVLPPDDIDLVSKKIEVLINADKVNDAITELRLVCESFFISGYCEEYLRLSDSTLQRVIWTHKKINDIQGFFDFIDSFFTRSVEFGRDDLFDKYMLKFTQLFQTPDKTMILSKSALCHKHWINSDYKNAITYGKSASDLIDVLGENDVWSGKHRYHLSLRDSQINTNVDLAIKFFCNDKTIEEMCSKIIHDNLSSAYGNVGRCLFYLGDRDSALLLYCKSFKIFSSDNPKYFEKHNIGYASKWIYEVLLEQGEYQGSLYFLLHARNTWKDDLPGESNKIERYISDIPYSVATQSIISLESWQITKYCKDWVDSYLNRI
ncbi:SIR2 family protein [Aeromonas veronii]|uniref:SIR2 family protein n=2 Tax=Aeromonas TaxID=642 RepID=UPI002B483C00|nr:SIR2 family protein [Aeromonas veronii]